MKVILDTNVFISAIFWGGLPQRIMEEWKLGRFELEGKGSDHEIRLKIIHLYP